MKTKHVHITILSLVIIIVASVVSCSKNGDSNNTCSGVSITVSGSSTNASGPGNADGSISVSASGGSGFTFKLNNGSFQSSGSFINLSPATYTITAKDSRGCTGSAQFTVNANDPCASVNFTVSATSSAGSPCPPLNGSIHVSASGGGSGFTFNLNGSAFQSSPDFNNLLPGNYTVGAKESGGCVKTVPATVGALPAGPLFTAVRSVILSNCAISGCHNGVQPPNFTNDCTIVANAALIKQRAVDGNPSFMPPTGPLSQADRDKITNWVNAGGRYTD
jgi:hypothetical protein